MFINNKRAEGTAFGWLLALVTLLGIGILYIIMNQSLVVHLQPAFTNVINSQNLNATQIAEINTEVAWYNAFWGYIPFIVFVVVLIWLIVNTVRRNKEDMYA